MRRILCLGAALLLAAPQLRADLGPRPGGGRPQPFPAQQPTKTKISIEIDEKATEPRLLVPMQAVLGGFNFGGGFGGAVGAGAGAVGFAGAAGAGGAAGFGGALGAMGNPPANFGNFGQQGGTPPPGAAGQKGAFGQLGGKPTPPPGAVPPGGQDEDPATEQESKRQSSLPFSTMIIGLALTLSFSTGGLWMARRNNGVVGGAKPLGLLVAVLSIGLLGGAAVWANRAPPVRPAPVKPQPQPQVPGPLPALLKMEGVKVEILPQGDTIRLILTKKQKEQIKGKDATAPAPAEKPEEK